MSPNDYATIKRSWCLVCFFLIFCSAQSSLLAKAKESDAFATTAAYFNTLVAAKHPDTAELRLFINRMPKGGDLHHHFTGSMYAESYLEWISGNHWWINKNDLTIITPKDTLTNHSIVKDTVSVNTLKNNPQLYSSYLKVWSDKDFGNHYHDQEAPDLHFFSAFNYFPQLAAAQFAEGAKILKARAKLENVQYLETMFKSTGYQRKDSDFDAQSRPLCLAGDRKQLQDVFGGFTETIKGDPTFSKKLDDYYQFLALCSQGVDDKDFMIRFQSYVSRNSSPAEVFSGLYAAFVVASKSDLVVGVNIVGPENRPIARLKQFLVTV